MFVFPMAGMSRRFTEMGYTLPKYMLQAHGQSLFAHAVFGFARYFASEPFMFIVRDVAETPAFVRDECKRLGVAEARIVVLQAPTSGQAETVALGLRESSVTGATSISIFNIDTFRPGFRYPTEFDLHRIAGYLEVFRGAGDNWSYVKPDPDRPGRAIATTEKQPVSDLCCTGLYHFASACAYLRAYDEFAEEGAAAMRLKELFVAPMYNLLIRDGGDVRYHIIANDEVIFCGVPAEYNEFLSRDSAVGLAAGDSEQSDIQ